MGFVRQSTVTVYEPQSGPGQALPAQMTSMSARLHLSPTLADTTPVPELDPLLPLLSTPAVQVIDTVYPSVPLSATTVASMKPLPLQTASYLSRSPPGIESSPSCAEVADAAKATGADPSTSATP